MIFGLGYGGSYGTVVWNADLYVEICEEIEGHAYAKLMMELERFNVLHKHKISYERYQR